MSTCTTEALLAACAQAFAEPMAPIRMSAKDFGRKLDALMCARPDWGLVAFLRIAQHFTLEPQPSARGLARAVTRLYCDIHYPKRKLPL